jgi:hypothetical protein
MIMAVSEKTEGDGMFCRFACAILTILIILFPERSIASPSGLIIIPTAEVLEPASYAVTAELDGNIAFSRTDKFVLATQTGIVPRLEGGVDFDLSRGSTTLLIFNAKYLLTPESDRNPALAAGFDSFGPNLNSGAYLVGSRTFHVTHAHLGILAREGGLFPFFGYDQELSSRLVLMADYTGGAENFLSVGGAFELSQDFSTIAGIMIPNAGGGGTEFTLHLIFSR